MNFRRFSFAGGDNVDHCVDELLGILYPAQDELEQKCQESLVADRFVSLVAAPNRPPRPVVALSLEYEKSPEEVVDGLRPEYFIRDFDPVVSHLEEISSWDKEDIIQKFMTKIEETDTDKDVIIGHLTTMIDTNYDSLMGCMSKVQEINTELCQAEMQIKHGRMKIHSAIGILTNGSININSMNRRRVQLQSMASMVEGLKDLKDLRAAMMQNISSGSVGEAAASARLVVDCLRAGSFERHHALRDIVNNVKASVRAIRMKSDKALQRVCCRKFDVKEYESVVSAYLQLDSIVSVLDVGSFGAVTDDDGFYVDSMGCLEGLAHRINRFQLEDIDVCVHSAVVEFIYVGQQKRYRAATEVAVAGAFSPMKLDDLVDLTEVPLHLLFRKLTADLLPHCVVRACERLADIAHAHFLLSQWHRRPFHPMNMDSEELHKYAGSGSVELDHMEGVDEAAQMALSEVVRRLVESRSSLWEEITRALVSMMNLSSFSADVKLEEFVVMLRSLQMMVTLGRQFCGSESDALVVCTQDKTHEFFRNCHFQSFSAIRMMVEAEQWQAFPLSGSLLEFMVSTLPREVTPVATALSNVAHSDAARPRSNRRSSVSKAIALQGMQEDHEHSRFLVEFGLHGNPFHQLISSESESSDGSRVESETSASALRYAASGTEMLALLQDEIDALQRHTQAALAAGKRVDAPQHMVVTQSVLNGLIKCTLKYLNMVMLVPSSAAEVLDNFFQVFNYYLCAVFCAFVSVDERTRFLSAPSKTTAPAPDLARDFEALLGYVERGLNEAVVIATKTAVSQPNDATEVADGSDHSSIISFSVSGLSPKAHQVAVAVESAKMSELIHVGEAYAAADASSCYALNERIVAAESTGVAAQILTELRPIMARVLPVAEAAKFEQFTEQATIVTRQLASLLYKVACPPLIQHSSILASVIDCGWDSKKLREHPHEWVDKLVGSCRQVWEFIMLSDELADSSALLREQVWLEMCQAAFDVVLEGFSRIKKCSSEGRATMTMDLFALHEGLNHVHLCRPPRGKHYLDNYLRAFYLSEDDLLQWVQENWQSYAYRHVHGLLTQTLSSMLANKKYKDAVALIDGLYEYDKKDGASKVTNLLSQRFKDENKFSNLLTSKFRR